MKPEYQKSDKKQYYSKVPKVEYERRHTFIVAKTTIKRSTSQNDSSSSLSRVPRNCNPTIQVDDVQQPTLNYMNSYSISMKGHKNIVEIVIWGSRAVVCDNTGGLHILLLEKYFLIFLRKGEILINDNMPSALVHGTAGIILDLQKGHWYFSGNPHYQFDFIATPSDMKPLLIIPLHPITVNVEKIRVPVSQDNNGKN
ncbi:hypothetical protein CEXT_401701 [Caerostris extrusa]|uniref:Uncharacterized protein n=1 Tax=Caerostris extrusa TaxID=172846 RepID=A0AAV4REZ4_CAEEX|nr:hypothetical protein CEXT_401701 [Caerostris extrusa]